MMLIIASLDSTDAAPDTLADYVIALLKHDKDMAALQAECKNELKDFISGGKHGENFMIAVR